MLASACSSYQSYRKAEIASLEGQWDDAVLYYMEAVERDPENLAFRGALLRAKIQASQQHFEKGKQYRNAGVPGRALVEFQQAVQLDPTNQYAQSELEKVRENIKAALEDRGPTQTLAELKEKNRGARPQPPVLNPRSEDPIDLDFPEPTSIKDIYRALGQAFGINVLFDPNLKDQEISITLKEVTAQSALEVLIRAAGHFYKVQDERTIIVVADTPQNRRNYEDLVIQTFFLSNADIKQVMTILRSLVDAKKIATNEQLNAIVLRDTADKVKVAERIIEANDKAKAEVVVNVELLQVNSTKFSNLGLQLSQYSVTQNLDLGGADVPLRLSDIDNLTTNNWVLNIPNLIYNFVKTESDAQLLAKPQLRITEGETARLLIGERVPIPTTTFNTSNTVGGNIVPLTTFQYTDVGIQIEIEPRVHHNKEITLKVQIEISNISGRVDGSGGQSQPIIGTRTIESTIRLRDGETNFLAGLIRTEEIGSEQGIPGVSDVPLLGRLFSNQTNENTRTDVILTMTPHIIRTPDVTEQDLLPIWVGTETNITFRGGSPQVESEVGGPFDQDDPRERVQEMLRQRLQRLPRGLRDAEADGEPVEEETPPGIELAPSSGPSNIFQRPDDDPGRVSRSVVPERLFLAAPSTGAALATLGAAVLSAQEPKAGLEAKAEPAAKAVRVSLVPQELAVRPGILFELHLEADSARAFSHLPATLSFDPEVLEFQGARVGELLGAEGEATVMAEASEDGRITLGASRLGSRAGVQGQGVVAIVTFRAKAEGETDVRFEDLRARDRDLADLPATATAGAVIRVDPSAPVPGPFHPNRPDGFQPQKQQ